MNGTPMMARDASAPRKSRTLRRSPLAVAAFIAAFIALSLALLPDAFLPPPTPKAGIGPLLKSLMGAQKDPAVVAFEARIQAFHAASLAIGIVGTALGVLALAKRESRILALSALVVSAVALVWQYLILGIGLALFILFLVGSGL